MPTVVGFDNTVKQRYTCSCCGAINEIIKNEIRTLYSGKDYGGGTDVQKGFNCANCGEKVITEWW